MTNRAKEIEKKVKAVAAVDDANDQIKEVGLAAVSGWGNGMLCVMVRYNPDTMQFEPYTGTELETDAVEVEVNTDTLEALTQTIIDQGEGKAMGFAGCLIVSAYVYIANEDNAGNYIIERIDTDKITTEADGDVLVTYGTGGLPAKVGWAALTYQDREATF